MGRWEAGAAERLARAAFELFAEQGFAATTVPQITARAGLTTRTFFRHFADKREVLFGFDQELPAVVAQLMAAAPAGLTPMEVILQGLTSVAANQLDGQLNYLKMHRAIVRSDAGLQEREGQKNAVLSEAVRRGFLDRGLDEVHATVTAQLTVTVFNVSVTRWLDENGARPLPELLHDTLAVVQQVVST